MTAEERQYQDDCIKAIIAAYYEGVYQQLAVMATGTGKTVVFSKLLGIIRHFLPGKVLIFAHREELVDQAVKTVREWNPEVKVGKEMADDFADTDCDVIVSCVASIGRTGATRLDRFGEFSVVICDEAHHSIASTYLNVFEATGVLKADSKKLLLGFTATPKRKNLTRKEKQQVTTLDEENLISLKSVYRKIVYTYPIRKAIKDGWLSPLRGYRLKTDTDLSNVKTTAGDYNESEIQDTVNTPDRNAKILKAWLEWGEGRQTVGFTSGIQHAKDLAALFRLYNVKAEAVWGLDPDRAEKIARHKNKEITVLFNVQLLTEGYDDWQVSCVILCAPTKNSSKFTQEVGRVTRLQAGIGNYLRALEQLYVLLKKDAIIIDVVDNNKRCSLVTFPSLLGLNPEFDLHGGDAIKAVEEVEALQEKYPGIDLTGLTDLTKIKAYIESIDIFSDPYPEEVKGVSDFSWIAAANGEYVISIPEKQELRNKEKYSSFLHEKMHIGINELDEWELSLTKTVYSGGKAGHEDRKLGTFTSLQEAITTADDVLRRCRPDRTKLMLREAPWHDNPATEASKRYLKKLSKNKNLIYCLCPEIGTSGQKCSKCGLLYGVSAGQIAQAINRLQHRK